MCVPIFREKYSLWMKWHHFFKIEKYQIFIYKIFISKHFKMTPFYPQPPRPCKKTSLQKVARIET